MKAKLFILIYLLLVLIILSGCGGKGDETTNNTANNNNEVNENVGTVTDQESGGESETDPSPINTLTEEISIRWEQGVDEDELILDSGGDVDTEIVSVGEPAVEARRMGNGEVLPSIDGNEDEDHYMQFRIDDDVLFEGSPTTNVQIEVEYYDEGTGSFNIQYDALSGGPNRDGTFKESEPVDKADKGSFQTAVFMLEDAFFGNRNNGADFRITNWSGEALIVRSVAVTFQGEVSTNVIVYEELSTIVWEYGEAEDRLFLDAGGDVDTEVVTVGDEEMEALRTGSGQALPSADGNNFGDYYMQFFIADKVIHAGYPTTLVQIEVEYYDEGDGSIFLQYDALSGGLYGDGTYKESDVVKKTDSGSFKTAVFTLDDAYFANRTRGADFRITDWYSIPVIIRKVSVTLLTETTLATDDWENTSIKWEQGKFQNKLFLNMGGDVDTEVVTVGDTGIEARRTGNGQALPSPDGNDFEDHYMQFGIDDNLVFEGTPTTKVKIEVEYYDDGTGYFIVQYDALSGGAFWKRDVQGV